ncbi:MAG: hypothetical protein ABI183_19340 [Polyangiaceae bacterium]
MHESTETAGRAWPLLAACLLHVALFASFRNRAPEGPAAELNPIDITIEEQTPTSDQLHAQQGIAEAKVTDPASASRQSSTSSQQNDSIAPPIDSATPPVLQTDQPQNGAEAWTFRSTRGGVDLGLGDKTGSLGRQMFARGDLQMPAPPPPPTPPPPPISPGVKMIQELDAQDVERGFGRGGPVVQAIETAVRDAVPSEGSATFEVAIEKSGGVSVRVLEAALNRAEWEKLSDAIVVLVKTKHIRFPATGLGLRVGVRVAASDHGPSGKKLSFTDGPTVAPGVGNPSGRDDAAMQQGNTPHFNPSFGGAIPMGGGSGGSQSRIVSAHEVYEQRM